MGHHSLIVIEPAAPVQPADQDVDAWGGYAEPGTDLMGWLEAIRPAGPPTMEE